MTTSIHFDGIFLAWHRHFVWLMKQELHGCGFPETLGMPYWNWTLWPNLETSPILLVTLSAQQLCQNITHLDQRSDGSNTSLGSNGAYDPVPNGTYTAASGTVILPVGSGGGCIVSGPFANSTVYVQPLDFSYVFTGPPANWTEPNPHCMTRGLNDWGVTTFNNVSDIDYMLAKTTIDDFNNNINGYGDSPGLHGGGHYAMGGTGYDFFGSPQEPAFYLHHSMMDHVWRLWQDADPAERQSRWKRCKAQ